MPFAKPSIKGICVTNHVTMNSGYSEDSETLVGWLVYPFLWHCIALVIPSVRRHMKPLGRVQQIG
jgi:hypothetical protein